MTDQKSDSVTKSDVNLRTVVNLQSYNDPSDPNFAKDFARFHKACSRAQWSYELLYQEGSNSWRIHISCGYCNPANYQSKSHSLSIVLELGFEFFLNLGISID